MPAAASAPAEWQARADKLCDRFPDAGKDVVAAALNKYSGHAGKQCCDSAAARYYL